jgi:hypothetical protein
LSASAAAGQSPPAADSRSRLTLHRHAGERQVADIAVDGALGPRAAPPAARRWSDACPAGSAQSETNGRRVGSCLFSSGRLMEADAVTLAVGKQGDGANIMRQLKRAKHALPPAEATRRAWRPDCQYAGK